MNTINEIKAQLDNYYQEYRENKNSLNNTKTKAVAGLIADILSLKDASPRDAAAELVRFSAEVSSSFFETIAKNKTQPFQVIESVLKELLVSDTDPKLSQYYVSKFSAAIIPVLKYYKEEAYNSDILSESVAFMARFAIKSNKNKDKFYNLINKSNGKILLLDYSHISKDDLHNIWKAVNNIYPDLTKSQYASLISEWGRKYRFVKKTADTIPAKTENPIPAENITHSDKSQTEIRKAAEDHNTTAKDHSDDNAHSEKNTYRLLYEKIKRDMDREQETIISAFTDRITPLTTALETIQNRISSNREAGAENAMLKAKIAEWEKRCTEGQAKLQAAEQSLAAMRVQAEELQKKVASLESQNAELDRKLSDAYAINSREASLEAEKVRSDLKKAFSFLYEDWLEYESSAVSEENYESLQVIIKKIFRSLERNGIKFKGDNT